MSAEDSIKVACPHCLMSYRVPPDRIGRKVKCKCGESFVAVASVPSDTATTLSTAKTKTWTSFLPSIPFIGRETDEQRAAREAAAESARLAKDAAIEKKRLASVAYWARMKFGCLYIVLGTAAFTLAMAWINRDKPFVIVERVNNPVQQSLVAPPQQPVAPVTGPAKTPSKTSSNSGKDYKEGVFEKIYEKATGKEVVHRKDGTTYERSQPKK